MRAEIGLADIGKESVAERRQWQHRNGEVVAAIPLPSSRSVSPVILALLPTAAIVMILVTLAGFGFTKSNTNASVSQQPPLPSRSYGTLAPITPAESSPGPYVFYLVESEAERERVTNLIDEADRNAAWLLDGPTGPMATRSSVLLAATAQEEERARAFIRDSMAASWGENALFKVHVVDLRGK